MSTGVRNNKALIFLVIVLLLSNIGVLLYFMVLKKPGFKGGGPRGEFSVVDFMKKEIGFSDEQAKQFKDLHDANRDSLKLLSENIRNSKNELYKLLQQGNATDSLVNTAAGKIADNQKKMELTMFHHFQKVRALCNPQQQIKLDSMVTRMNNRSPWGRRGGSPRSDGEKKKE